VSGDPDQDVVRSGLRILDEHIEVTVAVEDSGVEQLVFGLALGTPAVLGQELRVGERGLRVLVERFQIRRGGCGVEVVVELLDVLAVVSLGVGEPVDPLLEDGVLLIPEREREVQVALVVADPEDAILAPAVGPAPRLLVRERAPRVAVGRVVLADGPPLPLGEIGPELSPGGLAARRLCESLPLGPLARSLLSRCYDPPFRSPAR